MLSKSSSKVDNLQAKPSPDTAQRPIPAPRLQSVRDVTSRNPGASFQDTDQELKTPPRKLGRRTAALARKSCAEAYPDQPVETIHWDALLPGFGIREHASGRQVYIVQYRERGRTRRRTIAPVMEIDARMARRRARNILSTVKLGLGVVDPFDPPAPPPCVPFADFAERFWSTHAHRWAPATARKSRALIDRELVPAFGTIDIAAITRAMVVKWRDRLSPRPGIANRTLPVLSVMLEAAEALALRPRNSNPCRNVRRFKTKAKERFLSLDEITRLGVVLKQCEARWPKTCMIVRLLLLTGTRKGEIESLQWSWLDGGFAHLPTSKTGPQTLYLGSAAQALLAAIDRVHPELVFPGPRGRGCYRIPFAQWDEIRRLAGLTDIRLHDLRHTFASHCAMNGVSMPAISKLLGHTLLESTERYAHLADTSVREAAGRVSGFLARATGFAFAEADR